MELKTPCNDRFGVGLGPFRTEIIPFGRLGPVVGARVAVHFLPSHPRRSFNTPNFMLGVKRTLIDNENEFSVDLTMTAYVEGMIQSFSEYDRPKHVKTPFPEGPLGTLIKDKNTSEEEVKEVLGRGYMRLVGMLLWASRNVFPECAYGTSKLCSLMSCPSEKAWKCGMHMLTWLEQNKSRGIKFTHDHPNPNPIAMSDSSFMSSIKQDGVLLPHDFKDQYGWVIMWHGGPIAWSSRKHHHVGKSTAQVEYMAMYHCHNNIIAIRQLLRELDVVGVVDSPTPMFGDNKSANLLVEEDLISSGNQYIYMTYHALKEGALLGDIQVYDKRSQKNLADLFTKNVNSFTTNNLVEILCGYRHELFAPDKF